MNIDTLHLSDLHRHLDGSLRASTLEEFFSGIKAKIPQHFQFYPGMGIEQALLRFSGINYFLQSPEPIKRVASEICEDAAADGVSTLEIRFAPQLHTNHGHTIEEIIDAVLEGINGRAGLILCGLYGEEPTILGSLVEASLHRSGVVGIDIAGAPQPHHKYSLKDYAPVFWRAAEIGLGRTIHAGEGRPPQEIKTAIELLCAQRIGHGTTLLEDMDVVETILKNEVVIEACPTSNYHTRSIESVDKHPIAQWLDLGVKVCIGADNTYLSNTTAREEYRKLLTIPGMDFERVKQVAENGAAGRFKR